MVHFLMLWLLCLFVWVDVTGFVNNISAKLSSFPDDDVEDLVLYIPFNIIQVISRWQKGDNERLCPINKSTVHS